ncbi:MAG: cardiolipin synthase [Oscillospiraceae bacterium]|nr:cardiolipin synthase [Oscillospiraceae bacterium]
MKRLGVTCLLLIAQVFIIVELVYRAAALIPAITTASYAVSFVIILWLIKKDEPSTYKTIWIIIIMLLPVLGGVLYLIFEENPRIKRIDRRISREHKALSGLLDDDEVNDKPREGNRLDGCAHYIRLVSSYHAHQNTAASYYPLGELMFEDMLSELEAAQKFIFIEYFIIKESDMWDRMLEILTRKAQTGVDVRLIFDDFGGMKLFTASYVAALREKNIKVIRFNPMTPVLSLFMNNRNHRKMLVIDGRTAFNGGINIGDEYINRKARFGIWKDAGVKLTGQAAISFTHMFIKIWNTFSGPSDRITDYMTYKSAEDFTPLRDGFVMPYDDSPLDNEQRGENVYIDILNQARRYVYIFTPYLIVSEKMIYALKMAAKRGVDVRIVTPGVADKKLVHRLTRSYYRYLLSAGVRIYEYTPGFMHAKNFVSDDEIAVVGTINLDYRSLYLHFECATLLYGSSAVEDIREDAVKTIAQSKEIRLQDTRKHIWDRFIDAVLRLFAPLM